MQSFLWPLGLFAGPLPFRNALRFASLNTVASVSVSVGKAIHAIILKWKFAQDKSEVFAVISGTTTLLSSLIRPWYGLSLCCLASDVTTSYFTLRVRIGMFRVFAMQVSSPCVRANVNGGSTFPVSPLSLCYATTNERECRLLLFLHLCYAICMKACVLSLRSIQLWVDL